MSTYTLTIKEPNAKSLALLNLIRATEEVELKEEDIVIPQWQKDEVRKRIEFSKNNPDTILDWDDVKNNFTLD